jgi:hypothetical protein
MCRYTRYIILVGFNLAVAKADCQPSGLIQCQVFSHLWYFHFFLFPRCSQCPGILSYHISAETWKRLSVQPLDGFTAAPAATNSACSPGGDKGETPASHGDEAVNGVQDKAQPTRLGMYIICRYLYRRNI